MVAEIVLMSTERFRDETLETAASLGVEIKWVDYELGVDAKAPLLADAVVVVVLPATIPVELAQKCPNLKLVQSISAGTDKMDVAALANLGIKVANNGGGNAVAVAEHAIVLMVSTYRKLPLHFASVKAGQWVEGIGWENWDVAHELTDKRVGIVGAGAIGREVAKRLQGWDCDLAYSDVFRLPAETEEQLNLTYIPFDDLLETSDVVTLHTPLSKGTLGLIGSRELGVMKPDAILINTSRGGVVDEAALIEALRSGEIAGAGLDVLEQEPADPANPLLGMDNVVVTPHSASMSVEAFDKATAFALQNAARVVSGGEPLSLVQPE